MNDENSSFAVAEWRAGCVRKIVIATAESLTEHQIHAPPHRFYEVLAERFEERTVQAIAEAIGSRDDATVLANIRIVRRLMQGISSEIFLATEQADDPTLARLAAYLLLDGNDGYSDATYDVAWGAFGDPEWGTVWSIHQDVRDFHPPSSSRSA